MALALGEDRDQHIGAGHLLAAGGLHVDHRALDHALEAGGRLGILAAVGDQVFQLGFEIGDQAAAQLVEIDIAGAHHRGGVLIVDQRQQQMLQRRVFVVALVGERQARGGATVRGCGRKLAFSPFSVSIFRIAIVAPAYSLLFHHALQRMLMFAREVHDLRHFGFRYLVGIDAAFADPMVMHMHHDSCAASWSLLKNRSSTCTTNSIGV